LIKVESFWLIKDKRFRLIKDESFRLIKDERFSMKGEKISLPGAAELRHKCKK
jgi:hypothetical protein